VSIIQILILSIVEGITEFLPISSTGHLILTTRLLSIMQTDFVKSFEIIIQLGAILAVVVLYGKLLIRDWNILKKVITAFVPTAVIGLIFYKVIKTYLMGNHNVVLWSLLLGGVFLIIFELFHKESEDSTSNLQDISYKQAFLIGLIQSFAMIPGVSRSAATIIGGLMLGLKRRTIVEFSFLLAVPTMMGATGLDLIKNAHTFSLDQCIILLIGLSVSFVVAIMSIKFLLHFIKKHSFISFGVYRVAIALFFLR